MRNNIKNLLTQVLKEESVTDVKQEYINIKDDDIDDLIEDIKKRFKGASLKSLEKDNFFKDEDEGFFFHYNPKTNKYFESNASFQFVLGFNPSDEDKHKQVYQIYKQRANDFLWNNYNFSVDHKEKTVKPEKVWSNNKLINYVLEDIYFVQKALKILVSRHPETKNYKLEDLYQGVKTVEDFLKIPNEEDVNNVKVYFMVTGDDAVNILKDGIDPKNNYEKTTSIEVAKNYIKYLKSQDLDSSAVIFELKNNKKVDIEINSTFVSVKVKEKILPSELKIVLSKNEEKLEEKKDRKYYNKYSYIWNRSGLKRNYFIITKGKDLENLIENKENKNLTTIRTDYIFDGFYKVVSKFGYTYIICDAEKNSEQDIKAFLVRLALLETFRLPGAKKENILKFFNDKKAVYDFAFNGKVDNVEFAKLVFDEILFSNSPLAKENFIKEMDLISKMRKEDKA